VHPNVSVSLAPLNAVLRFVGISRNISLSIAEHAKALGDRVHSVKVGVVQNATKEALTDAWKAWLQTAVCI
jgi:hydrogenase maturation factor